MSTEFIQKVLRLIITAMAFMCLFNIVGLQLREAQQFMLALGTMTLFALLLRNIWLTLFMWLTVFLYSFFKFNCGDVYLTNIFYGCILFYLTKLAFRKEHIDFFINMLLWVLVINILYGIVQVLGYDFIYTSWQGETISNGCTMAPIGFMGNTSIMAMFVAMCIPLVATRKGQLSTIAAVSLFPMIWVLHSSTPLIAASIAFLFVMFFKYSKKVFIIACCVALICSLGFFAFKFSTFRHYMGSERLSQWQITMFDSTIHPLTGWGLDSFRNFTKDKHHVYAWMLNKSVEHANMAIWDNPHNLLVSLIYEFGILSWLLLLGYLRQCVLWFRQSDRKRNVIAIAGFMVAFFVVSMGHFPIFIARTAIFIVPLFAMYEIVVQNNGGVE